MKAIKIFLFIFALAFVFNAAVRNTIGYDLGWQMRDGEYIVKHRTWQWTNISTSEMAGYKWVSSSWGLNVIRYIIFNNWGFLGLTIVQALIFASTLLVFFRAFMLSYWEASFLVIGLVYLLTPILVDGLTGQAVSFLGTAVLYLILARWKEGNRKIIWLAIPLFFIWANLHGQFVLGLVIMGLWGVGFTLA